MHCSACLVLHSAALNRLKSRTSGSEFTIIILRLHKMKPSAARREANIMLKTRGAWREQSSSIMEQVKLETDGD